MNLKRVAELTQKEAKQRVAVRPLAKRTFADRLLQARQDLKESQKLLREI